MDDPTAKFIATVKMATEHARIYPRVFLVCLGTIGAARHEFHEALASAGQMIH